MLISAAAVLLLALAFPVAVVAQALECVDVSVTSEGSTQNIPRYTSPICITCNFMNPVTSQLINPTDITWERHSGGRRILLLDGISRNTIVDFFTGKLTIIDPPSILSIGDTLRCDSNQARTYGSSGSHVIAIVSFCKWKYVCLQNIDYCYCIPVAFTNPIITPTGVVSTNEGFNVTFTCKDPGNDRDTRYQWIKDGFPVTESVTVTPLILIRRFVQIRHAGVYACRAIRPELPAQGGKLDSIKTITLTVLHIPVVISFTTDSSSDGKTFSINCTFSADPPSTGVVWLHNGSLVTNVITIDTQPTYSLLSLRSFDNLAGIGIYACIISNRLGSSNSLLSTVILTIPDPLISLNAPVTDVTTGSVRLQWSVGYSGNLPIIGFSIDFFAISSDQNESSSILLPAEVNDTVIENLIPNTNYTFNVFVINAVGYSMPTVIHLQTGHSYIIWAILGGILGIIILTLIFAVCLMIFA
jgi:hypothetical protein